MAFQDLSGRVVLITGAARGIGRATVEAFVAEGAKVALTDVDAGTLQETVEDLESGGARGRVGAWQLDVTDSAAWKDVVSRVEAELGPIDVLVNNAGIMPIGSFLLQPEWKDLRQLEINVHGVIHGMRAVLPRMERRHRGHVVNIASAAGKVGIPFIAVYSASKHAVVGLTEAVRTELDGTGVDLSYVMPSLVETELIAGAGRLKWPGAVQATDVADAVVNAVKTGKVDVFVPRSARLAAVLPVLLPRRVSEAIARLLSVHEAFEHVDDDAREAYRARALAE